MLNVVSYPERGNGGNNQYRGNCSPKMIKDIITQYKISNLNDYMCGSGTTEDVCRRMQIESKSYDLNRGFDMMDMDIPERPENIFWHPPYADIIVYSDNMYKADDIIQKYGFDPRINDLSRCNCSIIVCLMDNSIWGNLSPLFMNILWWYERTLPYIMISP